LLASYILRSYILQFCDIRFTKGTKFKSEKYGMEDIEIDGEYMLCKEEMNRTHFIKVHEDAMLVIYAEDLIFAKYV